MKRNLNILLVLFFLILFFPACSKSEKTGKNSRENIEFTDVSQLNKSEYTIGYAEGQSSAMLLRKFFPNARTKSFLEQLTGYEAVRQGKVTAYAFDKVQTELAIKNGLKGVRILGNLGEPIPTAVGISPVSKIPHLEEKINEFITECRKSGLLDEMLQRWTSFTSDTLPGIKPAENPEYNLVIGTTGIVPPYSYHKGTELSGFDIELAMRFASWLGASYTFKVYDYGAIIAAAVTGDIDCIMANLNVTEERKGKIIFSLPIYSEQNVIVVRDDGISASQDAASDGSDKAFNSFADLNKKGVTIGMGTGTNFVSLCEKAFPLATLQYYNTHSDMAALILKDKLSAMVLDSPSAAELQKEVKGLKQLDEVLGKNDYAIGFPKTEKGAALRDQIDEFIEKKEKDGSLKKLQEVWFGQDESIKKIQPLPPSSPKGTIRMVTDSLTPPFSYIKKGRTVGYDIALVSEFCLEYGYALSITSLDFSAILPALHSASFDMAAGGMSVTSERKESIYFSRPLYEGKSVILVKDGAKSASLESKAKDKSQNSAFVPEQFKNVTLKYNSISEMDKDGLVLGMHTGFVMVDKLTRQMLPKAKIEYYKTTADMAYLVSSGKIDGFVNDEPIIRYVSLEIPDLGYIDFDGKSLPMIACFPKNEKGRLLRDEFNSYIKKCKTDGRLKAIDDLWLSKDEEKKVVDLGNFDAKKGVIRLGTTADTPPFEYMKDGKIVGYEIDLVARFCREAGYGLEIQDVPFDSLIMGLQSGMYDMVASCLSDTPAHRESTNISEPIYDSRLVMAVQILDHKKTEALSHGGEKTGELKYHSFDELNLNGKKIGVQTGSSFDEMAAAFFPKAEVEYFNSTTDMAKLLSMGKLDAMIEDEPAAQSLIASIENIDYIRDYLEPANFSAAFQKNKDGEKLRDEMNAFLTKAKSDGSLKRLQQIWFGSDESKKVVDYSSLPATNGTLKLATSAEYPPFEYLQNNKFVGYDIACAASFCKEYGYALKISDMNFDALLPALVSGACDFAIAGISVTEERSKSVNFSIPTYDGGVVVLVQKKLEKNAPKTKYTSADELKVPGKKMGVQIGDVKIDDYVSKYFPLAEKKYSNSIPELIQMLATNKIDAFLMDEPIMRYIQKEYNNFALLPFDVPPVGYSFGFAKSEKGKKLNDQLNQFVKKLKADGRLGEIYEAWFGDDEKRKTIDYSDLTGVNGTITLALEGVNPPFTYMKEDTIVGSNMEIVKLFCKEYGYDMKADIMNYDAIFPAIKSGKYDMCTELISTAERAEEMIFSIPTYDAYCSLVVALENPEKPSKFSEMIESLAASFEKTFVREGRWRLVLYGTGITILISIFSALFGTLLGFIICGLRLSRKGIADGGAVIYIRIMQGLPMVVFLMILYYIVFAKSELSGIWVAVIGFGMNFGAYVSEMIRTGILAVDKGQMEAALALGYPKAKAFIKMVLPQAARHFLPVYQGEFISLVKMTSVVGYIAIQDLTKAGDIIRSRTYEAFFPLITTAVIYFIIAWLLTRVLSVMQSHLDPKKRRKH